MLSSIPTLPCSSPLLDLMRLARCGLRTSRASRLSVLAAPILRGDQRSEGKRLRKSWWWWIAFSTPLTTSSKLDKNSAQRPVRCEEKYQPMAYKACKIDAKQQLCGGGDGRGRLPCGLWSATGGADGTAPGEGSEISCLRHLNGFLWAGQALWCLRIASEMHLSAQQAGKTARVQVSSHLGGISMVHLCRCVAYLPL